MSLLTSFIQQIFQSRKKPPSSEENAPQDIPLHHQELIKHSEMIGKILPGPVYYHFLEKLHSLLKPQIYLEIGVETGKSLAYANPPTIAIGVDPDYKIVHEMRARTKLFKVTSDAFFSDQNLPEILEHKKVEMAFIDGLHTFDQALKDFMNIERLSNPESVILFHDVYPVIPETADRNRHTVFWIGDTWKAMSILKKFRPDLKIFIIPTYTSGLAVVTNLDPGSSVLASQYDTIVDEAMKYELKPYMDTIKESIHVVANDFDDAVRQLTLNRPAVRQTAQA